MDIPVSQWGSDVTRVVCISDTHGKESCLNIPAGDVLIHAGDFSRSGRLPEIKAFKKFIDSVPHEAKVVISGNHEITLDSKGYAGNARVFHGALFNKKNFDPIVHTAQCKEVIMLPTLGYHYLEAATVNLRKDCSSGINIFGSPWQPEHINMAFNLPRGEALRQKWSEIPDNTDVLITHTPPYGILDSLEDGTHVGCEELLEAVAERVKPRVHVFGHIHECYGE